MIQQEHFLHFVTIINCKIKVDSAMVKSVGPRISVAKFSTE